MSVPKIAHRIWFGEPFPEKYKDYLINLVNLNPDYIVKLWSDPETVSEKSYQELQLFCSENGIQLFNIREFIAFKNYDSIIEELDVAKNASTHKKLHYVRASDISRKSILLSEGGIYTDTDSKMLAPFPEDICSKSIAFKANDDFPENYNYFEVDAKSWNYYFSNILYDFIASEPQHPLIELATEITSLDYQTYHESPNRNWEISSDFMVLCYGTVRLTGTSLKYALNYMHQSGKLLTSDVRGLFLNTNSYMQADFDKSWLDGFNTGGGSDPYLDNFLEEINANRRVKYITHDHGMHPMLYKKTPSVILTPKSSAELMQSLGNLTPETYDYFWDNVTLDDPVSNFKSLANILKQASLAPDITQIFVKAIYNNYARFQLKESILFWSVQTQNPVIVQATLMCYTETQRVIACMKTDTYGYTVLQRASNNAALVSVILESLPKTERLGVINLRDKNGSTVLFTDLNSTESIRAIFRSLPEPQWHDAITVFDDSSVELLCFCIEYAPESLDVILPFLPEVQRLNAILEINKFGGAVLPSIKKNRASIKVILAHLPEYHRLDFLRVTIDHQTVLSIMLSCGITISLVDDAFQNSFLPCYLAISYLLDKERKFVYEKPLLFYNNRIAAAQLYNLLGKCNSFEGIKTLLFNHVNENQQTTLSADILRIVPFLRGYTPGNVHREMQEKCNM